MKAHVTAEIRTVYRWARGCKLTRHAAYVGAAKAIIAAKCRALRGPESTRCANECRFHSLTVYDEHSESGGMEHYCKVLPRLVRFLKHVDGQRAQ